MTGDQGPDGDQGPTGDAGSGNRWYHGAGTPSGTSPTPYGGGSFLAGDMYLDTTNLDIYNYSGTAWVLLVSLD